MENLEFNLVSYSYQNKLAVDKINFSIPLKGGITVLLGQNGAGKTTTMKLLMGLLPPDEGNIRLGTLDPFNDRRIFSGLVGYLPEVAPLYKEMSVGDYLAFCRDIRPLVPGKIPMAIDDLLEKLGLSDKRNSLIGTLSKGMQQRVALAQAFIHRPTLLLLDEPTVGLDPQTVVLIRNFLLEMSKESTIILSTHILAEAQLLGSSFLIMKDSTLIAHGPYSQLREQIELKEVYDLELESNSDDQLLRTELDEKFQISLSSPNLNSDGHAVFTIYSKKSEELVPELTKYLVHRNIKLFGVSRRQMNLEDIFLRLNQDKIGELQ
jgi:ABC-2 type transport system ATP-binding protein